MPEGLLHQPHLVGGDPFDSYAALEPLLSHYVNHRICLPHSKSSVRGCNLTAEVALKAALKAEMAPEAALEAAAETEMSGHRLLVDALKFLHQKFVDSKRI